MREVYVDGSFTKLNPDTVGWGWVTSDEKEFGHGSLEGDITKHHQIGGEMKAVIEAILYFDKIGESDITILHDYIGLSEWVNGSWRCKNDYTKGYVDFVKKAKSKGMKINFVKIDASSNKADAYARKATGAQYAH